MVNSEARNLKALVDHLGIGHEGNDHDTLMALMNLTLHCLGGIRILADTIQIEKDAAAAAQDMQQETDEMECHYAIREIFASAVNRMMFSVLQGKHLNDLDPSRHLVESFPHEHRISNAQWLPIHWAVLGDDYFSLESTLETTLHDDHNSNLFCPESPDTDSDCSHRISLINTVVKSYPHVADQLDTEGRSILHYAARLSSVPLVECLIRISRTSHVFGPDQPNLNGAYPLHNAARFSKSLSVTKHLLDISPILATIGNNDGTLPLHWAAAKNVNTDVIDCLLKAHPEAAHTANYEGYLPLHTAGQNLMLDVVKVIYDSFPGAISVTDTEGGIPLHHACCFNTNIEVIQYLNSLRIDGMTVAQADGITPLHLAASQNSSPEVIEYLLQECPLAAYAVDIDGWLPLHCLVTRHRDEMTADRIQCVRLLLAVNPSAVSAKRNDGQTPYQMAKLNNHRDSILRLLLFAQPDYDKEEFARLNWAGYRRLAILSCLSLHRYSNLGSNGHFDYILNGSDSKKLSGLQRLERNSLYVIRKLTYGYLGDSGLSMKSNILRHIIKFL